MVVGGQMYVNVCVGVFVVLGNVNGIYRPCLFSRRVVYMDIWVSKMFPECVLLTIVKSFNIHMIR